MRLVCVIWQMPFRQGWTAFQFFPCPYPKKYIHSIPHSVKYITFSVWIEVWKHFNISYRQCYLYHLKLMKLFSSSIAKKNLQRNNSVMKNSSTRFSDLSVSLSFYFAASFSCYHFQHFSLSAYFYFWNNFVAGWYFIFRHTIQVVKWLGTGRHLRNAVF